MSKERDELKSCIDEILHHLDTDNYHGVKQVCLSYTNTPDYISQLQSEKKINEDLRNKLGNTTEDLQIRTKQCDKLYDMYYGSSTSNDIQAERIIELIKKNKELEIVISKCKTHVPEHTFYTIAKDLNK
tara:strand:+ start:84 stop:470 length:387 start_codon:yes stop_codon:yes gene_type:complete